MKEMSIQKILAFLCQIDYHEAYLNSNLRIYGKAG